MSLPHVGDLNTAREPGNRKSRRFVTRDPPLLKTDRYEAALACGDVGDASAHEVSRLAELAATLFEDMDARPRTVGVSTHVDAVARQLDLVAVGQREVLHDLEGA